MALRGLDALLLALHVVCSVAGLLLIKTYATQLRLAWQQGGALWPVSAWVVLGTVLYFGAFLVWMLVLARNELSVVYPIAVGATLAFSSLLAVALLGEALGPLRVGGILLIMLGVVLIVRS